MYHVICYDLWWPHNGPDPKKLQKKVVGFPTNYPTPFTVCRYGSWFVVPGRTVLWLCRLCSRLRWRLLGAAPRPRLPACPPPRCPVSCSARGPAAGSPVTGRCGAVISRRWAPELRSLCRRGSLPQCVVTRMCRDVFESSRWPSSLLF